jgi:hypothetical protein
MIQYEIEIKQLQTGNLEGAERSNIYCNKITIHQNKLDHKCTNAKALCPGVAATGPTLEQQCHLQLVSIPDPKTFNGSYDKLYFFVSDVCI